MLLSLEGLDEDLEDVDLQPATIQLHKIMQIFDDPSEDEEMVSDSDEDGDDGDDGSDGDKKDITDGSEEDDDSNSSSSEEEDENKRRGEKSKKLGKGNKKKGKGRKNYVERVCQKRPGVKSTQDRDLSVN